MPGVPAADSEAGTGPVRGHRATAPGRARWNQTQFPGAAVALLLAAALTVASARYGGARVDHAGDSAATPKPPATAITPYTIEHPGSLAGEVLTADLIIRADGPLPPGVRQRIRELDGVRATAVIGLGAVPVAGRTLVVAGVDPASYRRFLPAETAGADEVWQRVAAGDVALTGTASRALGQPLGEPIALGSGTAAPILRVGALASSVPSVDAVVNLPRASQLGITPANAMVVSAVSPEQAADRIGKLLPRGASVDSLAADPPVWRVSLDGGSVGSSIGSFTYTWSPDGTIRPDPRWVAASITSEELPVLGRATCHRVLFPQLRAALTEVEQRGLADRIDTGDFGGCYVPRFIGRDPRRGISLHTFGIAFDLNVATNQVGTPGSLDRELVEIFGRWGFAWGGHWRTPDPMHFELAVVIRS